MNILEYLNFSNGFYIEAGANDGISQSNTLYFEKYLGWSGILIEPNPHSYILCNNNRSKSNLFYNYALVSADYARDSIQGNFTDTTCPLTCMVTEKLSYYDEYQLEAVDSKKMNSVSVPAKTLQSILDDNNISKIDYFSLDVEGFEFEVMNGLNFEKNPPSYIQVETSSYKHRIEKTTDYMESKGYKFIGMPNGNDCFYQYKGI